MRGKMCVGALVVISLVGFLTGCGGSGSGSPSSPPPTAPVIAIKANSGSPQSSANGKPFSSPFSVTVTQNGIKVSGEKVTFAAPASGASGTFANGSIKDVEVTGDDGTATSSPFTANMSGGTYSVTATVTGASAPVSFSLTNIPVTPYSFSLSGQDADTFSFYTLAGSVLIDSNGNVLGGEQDYNDGLGVLSPQTKGDSITGGKLTFPAGSPAGQGTLTLNTDNLSLGLNGDGVEVFGVQFVNSSHALIMQFDGFATSSGSMDRQALPSALTGAFAFSVAGFSISGTPVDFGGVFSISGATLSGILDVNDPFATGITIGSTLTATLGPADAFGRGKITGITAAGTHLKFNYYIVGPEALRIIDVDAADAAAGSAFGQGTSAFSNASLGNSVLALSSTPFQSSSGLASFAALAQFSTSNASSSTAAFSGVGDDSEPGNGVLSKAHKILGTYSIGSNGYGSLNITNGGLGNFGTLGIYMTDPALNLSDPNNPAGGGGALAIDLSPAAVLPGGTGLVVPQTDVSVSSFTGNYAAGWQNFNTNCSCEFDMMTQGSMVLGGALSLTGLVSDPFFSLGTPDATSSANTFIGSPTPDTTHPGRYTMLTPKTSVAATIDNNPQTNPGGTQANFDMVVYQASGSQLFWLDSDVNLATVSLGPLEQQGSLSGLPTAQGRRTSTPSHRRSESHR